MLSKEAYLSYHNQKNLLTLGIKPNRPETGYGYIQIAEQSGDNFYKVKTFTEKPELELAKVFVEAENFIGTPDSLCGM